jgi:hypothetical protein
MSTIVIVLAFVALLIAVAAVVAKKQADVYTYMNIVGTMRIP